jgi:hypothetical protein
MYKHNFKSFVVQEGKKRVTVVSLNKAPISNREIGLAFEPYVCCMCQKNFKEQI